MAASPLEMLKSLQPQLAERCTMLKDVDLRLVLIDADQGIDKFYHIAGFYDPLDAMGFYCLCCWGDCGARGAGISRVLHGPSAEADMREKVAETFREKTGLDLKEMKPGDRAPPGKYWLQQSRKEKEEEEVHWEYHVADGVDGKKPGWFPYDPEASEEVENLYQQHLDNDKESRTATRTVSSGYFRYKVDLQKMTQTNQKTGKVRTIRRGMGSVEMKGKAFPRAKKLTVKKVPEKKRKVDVKKMAMKVKAMKKVKVMKKTPMKKAMKVSVIAKGKRAKSSVWQGKKEKTSTGLKKEHLKKNKDGKLVTKAKSEAGRKNFAKTVARWISACKQARAELGITGFVAVKKGTPLYLKAKELYPTAKAHVLAK